MADTAPEAKRAASEAIGCADRGASTSRRSPSRVSTPRWVAAASRVVSVAADAVPVYGRTWKEIEADVYARVLEQTAGDMNAAARVLNMPRSTFTSRLVHAGLLARKKRFR